MSPRARDALRRGGRAAAICAVIAFIVPMPQHEGPMLLVASIVNAIVWAAVAFIICFVYRILCPARALARD